MHFSECVTMNKVGFICHLCRYGGHDECPLKKLTTEMNKIEINLKHVDDVIIAYHPNYAMMNLSQTAISEIKSIMRIDLEHRKMEIVSKIRKALT